MWCWAKEVEVNPKNDLLLVKDMDGQTAWHLAACCGCEEILENLWVWVGEAHLNLRDDVFLCKNLGAV